MKTLVAASEMAVTYFGPSEGKIYDLFDQLVFHSRLVGNRALKNTYLYDFYQTSDMECADHFGSKAPGMSVSRKFDESPTKMKGRSISEILNFLTRISYPSFSLFDQAQGERIFQFKTYGLVLLTDDKTSDLFKTVEQVSKTTKAYACSYLDLTDSYQETFVQFIGASTADMPMLIIVDYAPQVFIYDGDVNTASVEDVTNFLAAHKAGTAQVLKRSQPIPAEPTVEGLTTLVHKTFEATYQDQDKDVLVFMYY